MSKSKSSMPLAGPTLMKASSSMPSSVGFITTTDRSAKRQSPDGSTPTDQEPSYVSRLWRNVIGQAVRDLYEGDPRARTEVFSWIVSPDFETVCDLADVHAEDMRGQFVALAALPSELCKKYGRLLREKIKDDSGD